MIIMSLSIFTRSVNGHKYKESIEINDETGHPVRIINEVKTPKCGWMPVHICDKACNKKCRNAQEFFDEIGVEY